jgi:hypothetical protein
MSEVYKKHTPAKKANIALEAVTGTLILAPIPLDLLETRQCYITQ